MSDVWKRKKFERANLAPYELDCIVSDIVEHHLSDVELASFVAACADSHMRTSEVADLVRAMINQGEWLQWSGIDHVFDQHCIDGVSASRTAPIVTAICGNFDLVMPRVSSRAIALPSSTVDMMNLLTTVDLSMDQIRSVVSKTNCCFALTGTIDLCPVSDMIIRTQEALDIESDALIVATGLAKHMAAGITDLVVEIPVGTTCKIKTFYHGAEVVQLFEEVASELGINVSCMLTDVEQPAGGGIGPLQEVVDVINVLRNTRYASHTLLDRAILISAELLTMARRLPTSQAVGAAYECVRTGEAWSKFLEICSAQGDLKALPSPQFQFTVTSRKSGTIQAIDNCLLSSLARLSGAPASPEAGVRLHCALGVQISVGTPLLTIYSSTRGQLKLAMGYYTANESMISVEGSP